MQKKIKKYSTLILIVISWIVLFILIYNYFSSFNKNSIATRATSLIEILGYSFFIANFSYSNVNWIFTSWRKAAVFLANPSVSWKMTTVYSVNQINENITFDIYKDLSNKYADLKFPDYYNKQLSKYEIIVNQNKYVLSIEKPDDYQIRITSDYRTSYRNSLKDLYSTYSEVEEIIRSNFVHPTDISYLLIIALDDYNPFYKIYLNHFEKVDKINFSMKYDLNEGNVSVKNNKISIQSSSLAQIKTISKEYIAISNEKLFN